MTGKRRGAGEVPTFDLADKATPSLGFSAHTIKQNTHFLNARSVVRSHSGPPSPIKPQAKLSRTRETALNSGIITQFHQDSGMKVGKTRGIRASSFQIFNSNFITEHNIAGGLMAKRFTDTGIWDKGWFRKLSPKMKEAWRFLCDKCDHAGVWDVDMDTMSHFINEAVTIDDLKSFLGDRLKFVRADKIFIDGFIEFQYNCSVENLNLSNKVHFSVRKILEKHGVCKPLTSPLQGAKDKDKDKDKDKVKERALEKIYALYPKKEGKTRAFKTLRSLPLEDFALLEQAVRNYAAKVAAEKTEPKFVKQFSTFANEWRDWVDYAPVAKASGAWNV
jgi:hypothetical protein